VPTRASTRRPHRARGPSSAAASAAARTPHRSRMAEPAGARIARGSHGNPGTLSEPTCGFERELTSGSFDHRFPFTTARCPTRGRHGYRRLSRAPTPARAGPA
jgi:hypothetical protein